MKKILITVEGGLGKHVMFTSLTKKLSEKYDEIHVTSPYPDIMAACKYITASYPFGSVDLTQLINDSECDIYAGNPYTHESFIKKKIHVLDAWSQQIGIEFTKLEDYVPIIDTSRLSPDIEQETNKIISELGKYILIQLTGGQSPIEEGKGKYVEILKRNYQQREKLVKLIQDKYPDHKILNFSLPNEPEIKDTVRLKAPYVFYFNLAKGATDIFCIDSSLQHIVAGAGRSATVIWGETKPEHFGWSQHNNMLKDYTLGAPYFMPLGPSKESVIMNTPDEIMCEICIQ